MIAGWWLWWWWWCRVEHATSRMSRTWRRPRSLRCATSRQHTKRLALSTHTNLCDRCAMPTPTQPQPRWSVHGRRTHSSGEPHGATRSIDTHTHTSKGVLVGHSPTQHTCTHTSHIHTHIHTPTHPLHCAKKKKKKTRTVAQPRRCGGAS